MKWIDLNNQIIKFPTPRLEIGHAANRIAAVAGHELGGDRAKVAIEKDAAGDGIGSRRRPKPTIFLIIHITKN